MDAMKRFFGLFKRKTTSSQSQSGDTSGHQDPSSEEASKPEPGHTSPGEWVIPGEIPSSPTPSPRTAHRISRQERRRRESELRKMIRKRESHIMFVELAGIFQGSKYLWILYHAYFIMQQLKFSGQSIGSTEVCALEIPLCMACVC